MTKKAVKAQQIEAKLLEVRVKDDRSLFAGDRPRHFAAPSTRHKDNPAGPQPANAKAESEMKLTVVRSTAGSISRTARASSRRPSSARWCRVAYVPSGENLYLTIEEFAARRPGRCSSSADNTSRRRLIARRASRMSSTVEAVNGAEVKTDDYIGMGHTITFDGEKLVLAATATVRPRSTAASDRSTNRITRAATR